MQRVIQKDANGNPIFVPPPPPKTDPKSGTGEKDKQSRFSLFFDYLFIIFFN